MESSAGADANLSQNAADDKVGFRRMVQNTNAMQQIALLRAELERAQATAAANLEGWQRTYAELQRSEADAAAFVNTLQQLRSQLDVTEQNATTAVLQLQQTEAELLASQRALSTVPELQAELEAVKAEAAAHADTVRKLQADLEAAKANTELSAAAQEELAKAKAEATANLDGWQRTRAEFANFKKRTEATSAEIRQFATTGLINKLLPVQDDFERAIKNLPEPLKSETWVEGVLLISRKVANLLDGEGVKVIEVNRNDVFDPAQHEAITHDEDPDVESGHVIEELQKGYKIGERVLRPSLVRVAK